MPKSLIPCLWRQLPLTILLVAGTASGQMIPLEDDRRDGVHVMYQDAEDFQEHRPPVPFAYWDDQVTGLAEEYEPCPNPPPPMCLVGHCEGRAWQISEFFPGGIQFSGGTSASWGIPPSGLWSLGSVASFKFRLDDPVDYNLFIMIDPGDSPLVGSNTGVYMYAFDSAGPHQLFYHTNGEHLLTGRLGPGTYELTGLSQAIGTLDTYQGLTYSAQWTISQPQPPAIAIQPADRSTGCGGTVVLTVGTTGPASNYTFQWRRSFVPLTDGPDVMGATTSTLTLTNVCSADDYDVVVTGPNPAGGGTIAEPSRLAHITIVTPTGVETEPIDPTVPAVHAPAPNPFYASTTVSFDAPKPTRLVATVYNVSGARVRSLVDRTVSGSGSVTWDGRLRSGAQAPAGVYFLRVELDGVSHTQKVALLE